MSPRVERGQARRQTTVIQQRTKQRVGDNGGRTVQRIAGADANNVAADQIHYRTAPLVDVVRDGRGVHVAEVTVDDAVFERDDVAAAIDAKSAAAIGVVARNAVVGNRHMVQINARSADRPETAADAAI